MITVLLAIDGLVFLSVLAVLSILFIILSAVDDPSPQGSSIVLLVVVALVALFTDAGQLVLGHPWSAVLYALAYFAVGCVYSAFLRWPLYLNGLRRKLNAAKKDVLDRAGLAADTIITKDSHLFKAWAADVYDIGRTNGMRLNDDGKLQPPQYSDNKARLTTWAILWPWNIFWVLVRKPIIWIFEELLSLQILKRICQAMSDWMFKDFNK